MRVPVPTGSVIDLTLELKKNTDAETINKLFEKNQNETIMITMDPIVSSDVIGRPDNQTQNAIELLKEHLNEVPVSQKEMMLILNENGISERTVKKAKAILGVQSIKRGNNWYWFLEN